MSPASENPTVQPSEPGPRLRLIPLDDTVVFPNMGITLTVDVGDDERVVLVPRHENEFLEVGTIAEVSERIRLPGGGRAVAISGEHRALIGAAETGPTGELRVEVDERPDEVPTDKRTREPPISPTPERAITRRTKVLLPDRDSLRLSSRQYMRNGRVLYSRWSLGRGFQSCGVRKERNFKVPTLTSKSTTLRVGLPAITW